MSDNDRSPFWTFSLALYARPGVAPACLVLQDEAGVDVNVLLFLLWNASLGRGLGDADIVRVEAAVGAWRENAVKPLRAVRRMLKTPPQAFAATAESLRSKVKAVELESERLQQQALSALAPLGKPAASATRAAEESLAAYERTLAPFPAQARADLIAAFAAFTTLPD